MIELSESGVYEFDEFRLDAKSQRLFRRQSDELVPLTPKAAELLLVLLQSGGRILSKDELLATIWKNSFVEESNLSQTIFVLRKTLGEKTKEPRFILTVPNRGYRFIAPVREIKPPVDAEIPESSDIESKPAGEPENQKTKTGLHGLDQRPKRFKLVWLAVPFILLLIFGVYWFYPVAKPADAREVKSIAVLPFKNIGGKADEEYLGQGLSEVLISKLSHIKTIVVRPASAVIKYADASPEPKKIGSDLNVEAVIIGRVQKVEENIRVTAQLVRVSDGATLWAETFDDKFTNIFAVQDSVSRKVVESLALQLAPAERRRIERRGTSNLAAYEEFLRGRFFWNKRSADNLGRAISHFNRAVEIDPNFAQGYAALAETYVIYNFYAADYDPEAFPKGRAAAVRALELDGELAEAHAALGLFKSQYDFDWDGAEKSYLRSIELNPNYATARQWYGEFLAFRQRTDESLTQMHKGIELDPTSLSTNTAPALPYLISRQFEKALETADKALEMDANFSLALHYKARALFRLGRADEAFETYPRAVVASNGSLYIKADLGCLYARAGREAEARKVLAELYETAKLRRVSPYNFAILHDALNEKAAALKYLQKTVAERDSFVITLPIGPAFENLRSDPQFIEILRRANL